MPALPLGRLEKVLNSFMMKLRVSKKISSLADGSLVDSSGQQLLAGPGFAFEQGYAVIEGNAVDNRENLLEKRTDADKCRCQKGQAGRADPSILRM